MSNEEKELLSEHDWRRLARTVQSKKCVLILGPGVAVDAGDASRTPLSVLLARSLAERVESTDLIVSPDDLAHVAQIFVHEPGQDRYDLEVTVEEFYKRHQGHTTTLHQELAALPFTLCVTTTPDTFMATAFQEARKKPRSDYYHFRKNRNARLQEPDVNNPLVFGLYGDATDPSSLVLSESDLLEFLVNVIAKTPPLPSLLTAKFGDPDVSFLFLGFGFHQWYVRILLHVLRAHGHRARSLALEDPGFFSNPRQREMAVFYEREHLIAFRPLSWEGFVSELKQHHDALVGTERGEPVVEPDPGAPLVFLCHVHEDKERVTELARSLQEHGIRVWLDKSDLRGGDEWDRKIQSILRRVDYVIVVQSPSMHGRAESYVYKEVRIALERQQHFATGYRFIVPTILDDAAGLDVLGALQFVDLSEENGIDRLVDTVMQDWRRRNSAESVEGI